MKIVQSGIGRNWTKLNVPSALGLEMAWWYLLPPAFFCF